MKYLPLIAMVVAIIVLLSKRYSLNKKNKRLEQLRRRWGLPNGDYYNFDKIERYMLLDKDKAFHALSGQAKTDIDFNDLFTFLDRTNSRVGQQYLFDKLCKPTNDTVALQLLNQQVNFFSENKEKREQAQLLLTELNDDNAYHIASLLSGELPERPKWFWLVIADIAITIFIIVLSFYFKAMLAWLMVPMAINMALHYWNKNNIFYFAASLPQLNRLVNISKLLSQKDLPFDNDAAQKNSAALKRFQRVMRMLGIRQSSIGGDMELVVYYLIDLIKAFFLVELIAFYSLVKDLKAKQANIHSLFKYVGSIDSAISIASLRAADSPTCLPSFFSASKKLQAKKIFHPLIENCVTNDIAIDNKSVLITGSNMSGKTTFLRTMAINSVLAQTIYTCFAESYEAPFVKLFSSIRIDDSVLDGKSYYFEEVNIMGELVNEVSSGYQDMFILDEVFKGTNTIERIAAAKAILSYLNKKDNIVFVSTHDIELAGLLKAEYDLYHFEENISENELQFDHTLKPGQLKTRNAIKILEISGYPAEIITEANALSKDLSRPGVS